MFDCNRHYIRVENGFVVKGFSDAFESPLETDICINENGGRHFEIDGKINPPLYDEKMRHIYRYDTELRKATVEELEKELMQMETSLAETETAAEPTTEEILNALLGVE